MVTCRDVITYALNLARVVGPGLSPSSREMDLGLVALQSMYDSWATGGMFGKLTDVYLEANDTAVEGRRYRLATGVTLTYPTTVEADGGDAYEGGSGTGEERPVYDLSLVESVTSAGVRTVKLYDRTGWVDLLGLELADTAPLASRGAYGLAAALATTGAFIAAFNDAEISPRVDMMARQFVGSLAHKFGSTQEQTYSSYY